MKFAGMNLIKYVEAVVASYTLAVGALFIVAPSTLSAPVYVPWLAFGAMAWGVTMVGVASVHFFALWLNGRNRLWSRRVRATGNLFHLYMAFKFATYFLVGDAPWGALTFGLLIPSLILPVLHSTITEARHALSKR